MLFANDYKDNRVYIDDTHSNKDYYCPYCGAPLITKKGEIRRHHFAHKHGHLCTDSWERNRSYDVSLWHNEWQSFFPKDNQEIKLSLGDTKHRADVLIDRTVIEFQHSIMPVKSFDDRNNFYFNMGYKVIWLFDLSELVQNNQLVVRKTHEGLIFNWKNPKKSFNNYDIKSGCIDLFFQINDQNECIVRVTEVSLTGFECFQTTNFISKSDFLNYVGLENGICLPPCKDDVESNYQYQLFKEKYHITLNRQQERAIQAVEGSNLLLAVPGSGKTTVLVARLGHMIINKNILPENILAITYNTSAVKEMKERFSAKFGKNIGEHIGFKTINSLALKVYSDYCRKTKTSQRTLIGDKEKRELLSNIYHKFNGKYAAENNILELSSAITYIKNMVLSDEEIIQIEASYPHLCGMYKLYQSTLKERHQMDFDDQMVFAYWILNNDFEITNTLRNKYKYICIDEAQDTSRIQHLIIKILAQNNNIFMVGDEDQSIYGYRGAYPKALLNFRYDYTNPYILRMDRNYRSKAEIVTKAQSFISKNKGRYEKNMIPVCGAGGFVTFESVSSREEQYMRLVDIAKHQNEKDTAFLYRDNESSVVLVDLLLRNNIPFKLRKPEMNFFGNHIVKDIIAYLSLAIDENDTDSLKQICNKGVLYLTNTQISYAIKNCKEKKISIFEALEEQMNYGKYQYRDRAKKFRKLMRNISKCNSLDAIKTLLYEGYGKYLNEKHFEIGKIEILQILAKQEPSIKGFIKRLQELELKISNGFERSYDNCVILSTIHSSKGLEYDYVYMVDVYDGRFPSTKFDLYYHSKDSANSEQEERRLFYVGITRAKNSLNFFKIEHKTSSFIDELFPEQKVLKIHKEVEKIIKPIEHKQSIQNNIFPTLENECKIQEKMDKKCEEYEWIEQIKYYNRYNEIKDLFDIQDSKIVDSSGQRWCKCIICGEIKEDYKFASCGGEYGVNYGKCSTCLK